jgi:hypothetical protein
MGRKRQRTSLTRTQYFTVVTVRKWFSDRERIFPGVQNRFQEERGTVRHIDVIIHKTTLCHMPENHNFSNNSFDNLKTYNGFNIISSPRRVSQTSLSTWFSNLRVDYTLCGSRNKALTSNDFFQVDSKGFWRWCITLRITGFWDFVYRPVF